MKQSSGHIMTGDILIIIFAGDAMSEDPKTKDCLTCEWEPEWEEFTFYIPTENKGCSYGKGYCRYPIKIPLSHTVKEEPLYNLISGDVQLFCDTIGTPISLLVICEAWEAK